MNIAYVAGLFDGEGCIIIDQYAIKATVTRPKAYMRTQLRVSLGMTHYPTIRSVYDKFGGMIARDDSSRRKNPNHSIKYTWSSWSSQAAYFLAAVEPFMIAKKEQAQIAIRFQKHMRQCDPIFRKHRGVPPNLDRIRAFRNKLVTELHRHKYGRFDVPKEMLLSPRRRWPYANATGKARSVKVPFVV